jgi:hypothetical protein
MSKRDGLAEQVGQLIGDVLGWAFCTAMLAACYLTGFAVAQYFGETAHRESLGLLSAFAFVWMYEHRRANDRWTRHFNPVT